MLTALLRSRTIMGYLLSYLICGATIIVGYYLSGTNPDPSNAVYEHWAFEWAADHSTTLGFLCIGLLVVGAFLARWRTRETRPLLGSTNLTMLCFTSIAVAQSNVAYSRPDTLVAMLLGALIFLQLGNIYKFESALSSIFHIGLTLAAMSLMVGPTIFLVVPIGFSLLVLRSGNWREWAALLFGVIMCVVFILMVVIWEDQVGYRFQDTLQAGWMASFENNGSESLSLYMIPILTIAGLAIFSSLTSATVSERNITLSNLGWLSGVAAITLVMNIGWQNGMMLAALPLSLFISRTLDKSTRWWSADLMLLLILASPFLSSLWPS